MLGVLFGAIPTTTIANVDLPNIEDWKRIRKDSIQWILRQDNTDNDDIRVNAVAVTDFFTYMLRTIEEDIGEAAYVAKNMKFSNRRLLWNDTIMKTLNETSCLALQFGIVVHILIAIGV